MVATEASLALAKKLIDEKIVQGVEAEMWLTQLAFIPRPSVAMLTVVKVYIIIYLLGTIVQGAHNLFCPQNISL